MKPMRRLYCVAWLLTMRALWAAEAQTPAEPAAPPPPAAVQQRLAEADRLLNAQQPEAARTIAEQALATARDLQDGVGEAQAHRAQALAYQRLNRTGEAVAA